MTTNQEKIRIINLAANKYGHKVSEEDIDNWDIIQNYLSMPNFDEIYKILSEERAKNKKNKIEIEDKYGRKFKFNHDEETFERINRVLSEEELLKIVSNNPKVDYKELIETLTDDHEEKEHYIKVVEFSLIKK